MYSHITLGTNDMARAQKGACEHAGTDEGQPGLRPHYHANDYGAYVRDPDGNKIQAVCHRKNG